MKLLRVYLRLYRECVVKAFQGVGRNLWTLLLPMGLFLALLFIAPALVSLLGRAGGFVLMLILDAMISCYLYFTGEVVAHAKAGLGEFKKSIGAFFWSVVNLGFVIWVVSLAMSFVLANNPKAALIRDGVWLLALILLNPSPEVIYQRGTRGGIETIQRSVKFIQENWIEWFIPNLLMLAAVYYLSGRSILPTSFEGALFDPRIGGSLIGGILFHLFMVFRGHLFNALDGTSHRQRMFRYRTAGSGG